VGKLIYLDYAGAHPVRQEVLALHTERCQTHLANPHASSSFSEYSRRQIDQAERQLLALLGIAEEEAHVIWTSGGTEADNLAILGALPEKRGPAAVVVDGGAHAAMLEPCRLIAKNRGGTCVAWGLTTDGQPSFVSLNLTKGNPVSLVAVCHANNETGAVIDLAEVRAWMARSAPKALLVVDAVQSFSKLDIPWAQAHIDFLILSGRKIGGPAGTGALVVRRGRELSPLLHGGGQQDGLRAGTIDVVGILEFVQAAKIAYEEKTALFGRIRELNAHLRDRLAQWEHPRLQIVSPVAGSPFICSFAVPGYEGAILMRLLAEKGILAATGSACSAESGKTSHVLAAMGISAKTARCVLRVSFGSNTSTEDVRAFVQGLQEIIAEY